MVPSFAGCCGTLETPNETEITEARRKDGLIMGHVFTSSCPINLFLSDKQNSGVQRRVCGKDQGCGALTSYINLQSLLDRVGTKQTNLNRGQSWSNSW